ncbi:PadR family transcriptional regulator [Clostridium psychrophilum]|uniref:PadR family transcriptional regulator n=1 Tax=Clostridium psychrophilum TaxID=132926 RepID=UPI001C0C1464|nr:PadR family transcriptional regulator [Clostridium psychrophilum]MBU3182805.1 PadR family transcriptional regulator [Clostridium psychrophilum]
MNDLGSVRNRQSSKLNNTNIVKIMILDFLIKDGSCYGFELSAKIEKIMNYMWKPSNGLIYPLLRQMEENMWLKGWWDVPDKKTRRNYKITDEGIKHFKGIKLIYKPLLDESLAITQGVLNKIYGNKL